MLSLLKNISLGTLCIIAFICFCIGVKYRRKHRELNHLYIYPLFSFLQIIIYFLFTYFNFPKSTSNLSIRFSIHIFIIVETICIFFFFYKTDILTNGIKNKLFFAYFFYLSFYIFRLVTSNLFLAHIFYIQSLIIIIPCFIYLYQLFLNPPILNLLEEPSFWFNSGLLIYFTLTLPLYFIVNYFNKNPMYQLIDFININGYIIIYIFLIKGYKCNPKITT